MNFHDLVAGDPFSTSLDRAAACASRTLGGWYAAGARAAQAALTPAERAEVFEYWQAMRENAERNAALEHAWARHTIWDPAAGRWVSESSADWAVRISKLRWALVGRRWRWIDLAGKRRMNGSTERRDGDIRAKEQA